MSNQPFICKSCFYPSTHPLTIAFDKNGVCTGCIIHREKYSIDWGSRFKKLKELAHKYNKNQRYDCIIPVCGNKDSYYIVHIVKNVLGLTPLLVAYNRFYNTKIGIRNLEKLRDVFNCDLITQTPNPIDLKKITLFTLNKMGSFHWPYLAGSTVFPVQIAVRYKIPLIIWGAHQGIDQVGMFSHHDFVEMSRRYRKEHDLMGFEAECFVDIEDYLNEKFLSKYFYPKDKDIFNIGIRGIYLNNYIFWDSLDQHQKMISAYKYHSKTNNATYDIYNDIHDKFYNNLHDHLKKIKHGFGKIIDHVSRDLRLGKINREQGLTLINKYHHNPLENMNDFCQFFELSNERLFNIIEQHRNKSLWETTHQGWKNKLDYSKDLNQNYSFNFIENPNLNTENNFQLLLKGSPEGMS